MTRAMEYRAARPGTPLSELKIGDAIYLERVEMAVNGGEVWLRRSRRTHFNVIKPYIIRFKHIGQVDGRGPDFWEIHTSAGVVYTHTRHRYHKAN